MTVASPRISVVGLGKLGAPMAACFAARGFPVTGVDLDDRKVDELAAGRAPVFEPGLDEMLAACGGRLRATTDLTQAVAETDVTFIVVATPSGPDGGFSPQHVLSACETIGRAIGTKDDFHVVVLTSTVMPGATGGPVREALERASGKECGRQFGLCYSPEFIALGSVIRDFLNPDFLLIGESDERSGDVLEAIYAQTCDRQAPAARMNFVNAELAKISVNTFVTTKIAFANMLARICERLPQADVDTVTGALGLDSRIGAKYLRGAVSYGGPCFPRDNVALAALARQLDAPALVAEATDRSNREDVRRLAARVAALAGDGRVGILGLSYKPNTDVVEESPGLLLAEELLALGIPVTVFDPAAAVGEDRLLGAARAASTEDCIRAVDVAVLMTLWPEFADLDPRVVARDGEPRTIVDCWRALDPGRFAAVSRYVPLGRGLVPDTELAVSF